MLKIRIFDKAQMMLVLLQYMVISVRFRFDLIIWVTGKFRNLLLPSKLLVSFASYRISGKFQILMNSKENILSSLTDW